jgi:hypothetical protein
MTRFNFISAVAQALGFQNNDDDYLPTGAEAVITDYTERQNLAEQAKETVGYFAEVERVAVEGHFNSNAVANIVIEHEYGTYTVTLDIEEELPEFMDSLNQEGVEALQDLVENSHSIPLVRDGGEWRIEWENLEDWELYSGTEEVDVPELEAPEE